MKERDRVMVKEVKRRRGVKEMDKETECERESKRVSERGEEREVDRRDG